MRFNYIKFAVAVALVAGAACSEPTAAPSASTTQRSFTASGGPAFDYSDGGRFGSQGADFTVTSSGGSFSVNGLFTVSFPANAVCDPAVTPYGPTEWEKPCVTLGRDKSVRIHAVVQLTSTGLAVDFAPELRFSPKTQVTLSTDIFARTIVSGHDYFAKHPSVLRPLALYYVQSPGGQRIADYLSDPTLVTHIDLTTGRIWRRVKHFSGWSQSSGEPCDPSPDVPDCIQIDGDQK